MSTITEDMLKHAKDEYPRECCGLLLHTIHGVIYFRCTNVAINPLEDFTISGSDYVLASKKGKIVGVVHSHPNAKAYPSVTDIASCNKSKVPWTIISYPDVEVRTIQPIDQSNRPYKGRYFIFGVDDCYSIIQDFYSREYGIELTPYYREYNFWNKGIDYYTDRFEDEGFISIPPSEIEKGDVVLMYLKSKIPNHGGIYYGNGTILHHIEGRLSAVTKYDKHWKDATAKVLRHRSRNG